MIQRGGLSTTFASAFATVVLAGLILWGSLTIDTSSNALITPGVVIHFVFNTLIVLVALGFSIRAHPYSMHLFHLVGLLIFGCVGGLYQYLAGNFPLAGPVMIFKKEIPIASVAVTLWVLAYLGGYVIRTRFGPRLRAARFVRSFEKPVSVASVHFALIVGFFSLIYLASLGLVGAFTRAAADESLALAASGPVYFINNIFVRALPLIAVAGTALAIRRSGSILGIGLLIPMFVFDVVGVLVTNSPFAAARYWFVAVAVGLASPHLLAARKTAIPVLVCLITGLSVLPSIGAARDAQTLAEIIQYYLRIDSPFEYLATSGDVDAFGMMCLAVKWLDINGPTGGLQMLGALLFWVPRTLWPSKPVGTGAMVSDELGFDFTNLSVPIMTEPLVDFGLLGVPVVAFGFGWLLAALDRSYWTPFDPSRSPVGFRRIDVIYPFWVGMLLFVTRGDLLSSFGYTVGITLAMIPFVLVPARIRSRHASEDRAIESDAGDLSPFSGSADFRL
ncbi:MAG: hypothetical protein IPK00_11920 [Deltaproteobacteria bacterium]|nr:hypothetical protein [Deltaproteobacteria bacterium]